MDDAELIYLEADDEVTSVIRRLREATAPRVIVVAPGRSRATSSTVALRLIARFGAEAGHEVTVVGDALTRSLAAEAGVPTYSSVADARVAAPVDVGGGAPRRAGIQVVRGTAQDPTPTMLAAPLSDPNSAWAETRPLPSHRVSASRSSAVARWRRVRFGVPLALVTALLAAAVAAGAVLLPAAQITLRLRTAAIPARTYTVEVTGEQRVTGTLQRVGTVTPSGSYPILTQATGTVILFNFSAAPVDVDAGTLVATGEEGGDQAFSTATPVVVPEGSLTPQGTIQAGEAAVDVMAAAAGPAGNVGAAAIDTVLSPVPRNRLRGFANNAQQLVVNPAPTSGGTESSGSVILQEDVDAAVAAVRAALAAAVAEVLERDDQVPVPVGAPPEPTIEGADGLVGTQDVDNAEIRGSLAYDQWLMDPNELERVAVERLVADDEAIPPNYRLVPDATSVRVLETVATDAGITATVSVTGRAQASVDEAAVIELVRGRGVAQAERALEDLGQADIDPWPGWVTSVPDLEWRLDVRIETTEGAEGGPSPSPAT